MPEENKPKGQSGYMLIWVLVLMTFGALVTAALLDNATAASRRQRNFDDSLLAREAAEAGLKQVVADLIRGADAVNTTYILEEPHTAGSPYSTFTFSTSYAAPSINVNYITPTMTITSPPPAVVPSDMQQYIDPGLTNPDFATLPSRTGYLLRLYQVKAGALAVNWAYSPAGISRIGVWAGVIVDNQTNQPYPPGRIDQWPQETPILDTGHSSGNSTYNRTATIQVDAGIYSVVFYNGSNSAKTNAAYAPSGALTDTWIYIKAYRDYLISVTANNATVKAYVRQVPGYSQPPGNIWDPHNVSWITNSTYIRSFDRP